MFFSIVLRKSVSNLYDCNFAHVTSTHAVNVSARLLWMDFTGCSMIHNSQHQLHERHEQQLPNSWNLYINVHAFQLHTTFIHEPAQWMFTDASATREWLQTSDARWFCKDKQVNLKNKPKIGNLTEKQAQHALAGKFNKTKNQQDNQVKKQRGKSEKTSPKGANFHKNTPNMTLAVNWNSKSAIN